MHKNISKILWAVDAYAETDLQNRIANALKAFTSGLYVTIVPTYVLTPVQIIGAPEYYPDWKEVYTESATRMLTALAERNPIPGLQKPRIIVENIRPLTETVERLLQEARKENVDLIAVSTHAKKLNDRILVGTFAETLLLHSDIPVFVTNPESEIPKAITSILFASDFLQKERSGFEVVLNYAKTTGSTMTLFHKLGYILAQDVAALTPPMIPDENRRYVSDIAEEWIRLAESRGVKCELLIDDTPGPIAKAIWQTAVEQQNSLIAMEG